MEAPGERAPHPYRHRSRRGRLCRRGPTQRGPGQQVLLLEAGGRDWNPLIHMPAGFTKLTGPSVNWGFETVPQPELNDRRMHYPQGRTLGGSTSINAMIYIRGNRLDYDEWRDLGNEGWGYDGVLPYFRKSENNERLADEYHGTGGPMNVTEQVAHNPISKGFVRAAQSIGIPFSHDFNGAEQAGVGFYDVTQRNVRRESSATAYLGPARKRKNLVDRDARPGHPADHRERSGGGRQVPRQGQAGRGEGRRGRRGRRLGRGGELTSPAAPVRDRAGRRAAQARDPGRSRPAGVGKNFQDHMDVYLTAETAPVSYNGEDRWDKAARHGIQYLLYKTGPGHRVRGRGWRVPVLEPGRSLAGHPDPLPARVRRRPRAHADQGARGHDQHLQPAAEEHRLGHAALCRSARGARDRSGLPPGSLRLEDLDGGLRARSRDPQRARVQGPHPKRERCPVQT